MWCKKQIRASLPLLSFSYRCTHETHHQLQACRVAQISRNEDLVQLHGAFSKTPRTDETCFTLNLSLPTGTLHATGTGSTVRTSCKKAFSDLEAQVKKHQAKLRKDYEWRRKRPLPSAEALL